MSKKPHWHIAPYFIVDDVHASANYYRDKLGFSYDEVIGEPPSFCMVGRAGLTIMLKQLAKGGRAQPNAARTGGGEEGGAWDAYIWIDDADALHAEFKKKGATIVRGPHDQEYGCREFEVNDLNGYRLCFGQV